MSADTAALQAITAILMPALGLRDRATVGHSYRVSELCGQLGEVLGFSPEDVAWLRVGGLLHDIGKIGIPDAILYKPSPLNGEEWQVIRNHPGLGADLLRQIPGMAEDFPQVIRVVECHHEHWDGGGYPAGLSGEQIPPLARVCAVVEAYDGMIAEQVYKPLWTVKDVIVLLEHNAGKAFDPQVVSALHSISWD